MIVATTPSRELSGEEISNRLEWQGMQQLKREHGAPGYKGLGYFGEIPSVDKEGNPSRSTELAGEMEGIHFPLLVPTLTKKEIDHLVSGKQPTDEIWDKAYEHALIRGKSGKDPFATKYDKRQKIPTNEGATMATTLDAINNPLSPLGLTSLMGGPAKEKPAAPVAQRFGEDDVGTAERILSAGRTELEQLRSDKTRMAGEAEKLTNKITADTANLVSYRNAQEVFKAQQKVTESQELEKNIKKMLDDERDSPQYKEKQRINKEIAEYSSFVPTEVTAPMLGVLFSAIGATGMLLGGNSKSHAKFAMAAMNGMAEGFNKGREQYNKEQKAAFDTNVKLLQTKLSAIKDGLEDARREAILNKEAADMKVRQTLASNEAKFLQENTNKRGLESTIALVDGQLKNLNRAIQFQTTKVTQLASQLDAKEIQLAMRRIEADRRQAEAAASREFRAQQSESDRALRTQIAQGQLASQAQGRAVQVAIAQLRLSEAGTRRDVKALQDIGPALRNIAINYPDGTANNLVGASADDKKKIQGAFRALQESEETADFIAKNPRAVGALAKLRNFIKVDAIQSLKSDDETQTVAGKSAILESQIDAAANKGIVTKDEAEAAKILEKRLFGLALADVQGSGQRGSVYLDRQFQNLYDQASRPDTLLKVIKERSGENNRNLKIYRLGVERHENPELFPLTLSETQNDFNRYIQERSPAPRQDHIERLRSDPSPKMKKFFDEAYGEGAANRILGSK